MDINPYQAPQTGTLAEMVQRRPWFRLMLGGCCFCTTLLIAGIGLCLCAFANIQEWLPFLLSFGILASSTALMGVGIITRRHRLALAGSSLFFVPFAALVVMRIVQIART